MKYFLRAAVAVSALLPAILWAQNTGAVFGPVVNAGHQSLQYRATYDTDSYALAQRLHYQQAVNSELMWRLLGQLRKTPESDFDEDFLQAELWWQLTPDGQPWQYGLRFDLRYRSEGRPAQIGVNWTNQYQFTSNISGRALLLTTSQFGNGAADGLFVQTRASLQYHLNTKSAAGVEWYSSYGRVDDIQSFDKQAQQLGPFISHALGNGFSLYGGALLGLNSATPDGELRLWLTKGF